MERILKEYELKEVNYDDWICKCGFKNDYEEKLAGYTPSVEIYLECKKCGLIIGL